MTPNDSDVIELMWAAWRTDFGLRVEVSDVEAFRVKFYKLRKAEYQRDPANGGALYTLSCRTSPRNPLGEIWIVKGARQDAEDGGAGEGDSPSPAGGQGGTGQVLSDPGPQQGDQTAGG